MNNKIKKAWNFLWHDDSWASWIVFVIVMFVIIKFIFFPTISFIMGTSLPIVIVESCSMYHDNSFDNWWQENGAWYEDKSITKEQFAEFSKKNGFTKGDIFFVRGTKAENIKIGDTIIFVSGAAQRPIIHRVVSLNPIQTKGDHNALQFTPTNNGAGIDETNIKPEQIIGKVTAGKIPLLGWLKLIFYEPFRPSSERGLCK